MEASLEVKELATVSAKDEQGTFDLRSFSLSLNGITVHLCTVGASISNILLPNYASSQTTKVDDIVLGYKSPADMLESDNPPYFGVIVGRVANRIAKGKLETANGHSYHLDINNGPNHLHGGLRGFSRCVWDAEIVSVPATHGLPETKGVKFSLTSKDGDQGYPGTVQVTATYTLVPTLSNQGAVLRLVMDAKLLDAKITPIAMAQHSYINLASHNEPNGVLNHKLTMPSEYYTPVDENLIPTREVRSLDHDPSMDWRMSKLVKDALVQYGIEKAGLTDEESKKNINLSHCAPNTAKTGNKSPASGEPYGFDHNYVVKHTSDSALNLAGIVEHEETMRRMTVWTDQPGVQLYTGNFLDGVALDPSFCKDSASYLQWQSICLETQTYPDSTLVSEQEFPEFAKGKCHILRPGGPSYHHTVEYRFEPIT
jgi:aldose 1-epimerase